MLFGRRKPGFSKEVMLRPDEISDEFSDRNDPAMTRNSNPKEEKGIMAEQTVQATGVVLPGFDEEAQRIETAAQEGKMDIFEYLESMPDVEDPFEPSENPMVDPEPEMPELKPGEMLAEYIRERTRGTRLTSRKSLEAEELEEGEEIGTIIEEMLSLESCKDIRTVKGRKDEYFYSDEIMANNYAMIAMLVEEKDIAYTMAHMVRFNCRTYPSPTPLYYFIRSPYFFSKEEIDAALERIKADESTQDIKAVKTPNDVVYLYSEEIMSRKYAQALANDGEAGEADY